MSRIQSARRALQLTAALAPLMPQVASMGKDNARRESFGRSVRRTATQLGGIYPWVADLLADLPALAGPSVAKGVQFDAPWPVSGPFVGVLAGPGEDVEVVDLARSADIATDLGLLSILVKALSPFTGSLSSTLATQAVDLVSEQVRAEASVDAEYAAREKFGSRLTHAQPTQMHRQGARVFESVPTELRQPPDDPVAEHRARLTAWYRTASIDRVALPNVARSVARSHPAHGLTVRRVAGTQELDQLYTSFVDELAEAGSAEEAAHGSLSQILERELGATGDAAAKISMTVVGFAIPTEDVQILGPLTLLRELDRLVRSSGGRPILSRSFFLIVRQLAILRGEADQLGIHGRLSPTSA